MKKITGRKRGLSHDRVEEDSNAIPPQEVGLYPGPAPPQSSSEGSSSTSYKQAPQAGRRLMCAWYPGECWLLLTCFVGGARLWVAVAVNGGSKQVFESSYSGAWWLPDDKALASQAVATCTVPKCQENG